MKRIYSDTGPFSIVPEWILDAPISDRAVRLYAVLARYADDTGLAHPSRATLARRIGCSPDTIDRTMPELVALGAVEKENRQRGDTREADTNLYRIVRVMPEEVAARVRPRGRVGAATGGRVGAAGVAAGVRQRTRTMNESQGNEKGRAASRPRDPLWDAFVKECGYEPGSRDLRGAWNKAVAELRDRGATPDEVKLAAKAYRKEWPGAELTPNALAKWWDKFLAGKAPADLLASAISWAQNVGWQYEGLALEEELRGWVGRGLDEDGFTAVVREVEKMKGEEVAA